jgi:hypothetical protein
MEAQDESVYRLSDEQRDAATLTLDDFNTRLQRRLEG